MLEQEVLDLPVDAGLAFKLRAYQRQLQEKSIFFNNPIMPRYIGVLASLAAQKINEVNKTQSSQALTIKTYSNSVLNQPDVDFSCFDTLTKYQSEINTELATAKTHANNYLNSIQPSIITNISNYYALHSAVATTLPPGSVVAPVSTGHLAPKETTHVETTSSDRRPASSEAAVQIYPRTEAGSFG